MTFLKMCHELYIFIILSKLETVTVGGIWLNRIKTILASVFNSVRMQKVQEK